MTDQSQVAFTLLSFENDWCVQCYTQRPIIEQIANEYQSRVNIKTINIDHDEQRIAAKYHILSAPTTILIKDHQVVERVPRFIDLSQLQTLIRYYL